MHKGKKTGIIGILMTIIILTVLVFVTNIDTEKFSYVEGMAQKLVVPIQNGLTYLKNKVAGNNLFFEDINNLKNENEKIRQENEELKKQLSELRNNKSRKQNLKGICKPYRSIYKI